MALRMWKMLAVATEKLFHHQCLKKLLKRGGSCFSRGGRFNYLFWWRGIPVVAEDGQYVGVEAVNDKDFSARVLAENVDADRLIILTGVDNIYINYNQPDQKALEQISVAEAEEYIKEGHFAAGSMLPKIEAALDFVKGDDKRKAIITSIENLENIDKEAGTVISQKGSLP